MHKRFHAAEHGTTNAQAAEHGTTNAQRTCSSICAGSVALG